MRLRITILFLFLFIASIVPRATFAQTKASGSSAILIKTHAKPEIDKRAEILRSYLKSQNSPLMEVADTFVEEADRHNLDWKLVVSIAGVESTFARFLPYRSYNAWGWGIYGDNVHYFSSYKEAIQIISRGLRENYMDKWGAQNVYQIGDFYAADPNWARKVTYFMDKIKTFETRHKEETLPLSL